MIATSHREPSPASQIMILLSFTAMSAGLVAETVLMGWELWAIPLIAASVAVCWALHVRSAHTPRQRLWTYTALMMAVFFFYGTHPTSTYDMALLMMCVMIIYTVTGMEALVTTCQLTYFLTLAYDLLALSAAGTTWDSLLVSRTILHAILMLMAGWLARAIIRQWAQLLQATDERLEELDQTARGMNVFLEHLSHELRTPINAILGMADVMEEQESDPVLAHELQTVQAAGNVMKGQVDDILDYSEVETGKLVVNREGYALSSLVSDVVSKVQPQLPAGVELVVDVDAEVPAGLVGDASMVRTIVCQLLENSLRYTQGGGVYLHLSGASQPYGTNLRIEVSDTGIGMTPDELRRATQAFYQAESGRSLRAGGLGLGLSIVQGFVSALGGFMVMDSTAGRGTTVRVSLPQEIANPSPCLAVERSRICLAAYFDPAKFSDERVRGYYNTMIYNLIRGMGITMHRVDSEDDLRRLVGQVRLTHLFAGVEEYERSRDYLEELAREVLVTIVARDGYLLPDDTRVSTMPKPLYCFPVAAILETDPEQRHTPEGRLSCPGVHALVVDDEPMNLMVAEGVLRRYGMSVSMAHSGAEAVQMCTDEPFDIVFMDHMMPGMDGVEALRRIRAEHGDDREGPPIVALTANALSTAREMFRAEGFDGFVRKPIETAELERTLRRVLPAGALCLEPDDPSGKPLTSSTQDSSPSNGQQPGTAPTGRGGPVDKLAAFGFDTRAALRFCQQDKAFYQDLLRQFVTDAPKRGQRLAEAMEQRDCAAYALAAHSLKGTALTIGATQLGEQARALEEAAKAGRPELLHAQHDDLQRLLARATEHIRQALGEADRVVAIAPSPQGGPIGPSPASPDAPAGAPEVFEFAPASPDAPEVLEFVPLSEEAPL